ncbi:basic salivary proline-rich protein 1-like [Condylostylus longicornis]|uniref:basic salivary proline-rich protein 1-like n=1 Tax=Condylostylus longicornis TaxID=2530218 RepID=UPI00244E1C36|nr:basic salivary proline-rich protein 1-like [Condylostylus longicornis]
MSLRRDVDAIQNTILDKKRSSLLIKVEFREATLLSSIKILLEISCFSYECSANRIDRTANSKKGSSRVDTNRGLPSEQQTPPSEQQNPPSERQNRPSKQQNRPSEPHNPPSERQNRPSEQQNRPSEPQKPPKRATEPPKRATRPAPKSELNFQERVTNPRRPPNRHDSHGIRKKGCEKEENGKESQGRRKPPYHQRDGMRRAGSIPPIRRVPFL